MSRTVIYSRVSTALQETSNQIVNIKQMHPHAEIVEEVASGIKSRPALEKIVTELQAGDVLIVAALDRLGRKTSEILLLIEGLEKKGVILKSVREAIDFSTIAGRLVCQILISVSEMERRIISERTKSALAAKKKLGIIGGRRPKFSKEQVKEALTLREAGVTIRKIAQQLGMSTARVQQLTKEIGNVKSKRSS